MKTKAITIMTFITVLVIVVFYMNGKAFAWCSGDCDCCRCPGGRQAQCLNGYPSCEAACGLTSGSGGGGGTLDNPGAIIGEAIGKAIGNALLGNSKDKQQQLDLQEDVRTNREKMNQEQRDVVDKESQENNERNREAAQRIRSSLDGGQTGLKPRDLSATDDLQVRETRGLFGEKELKPIIGEEARSGKVEELIESDYFYALQTRTLTPMGDGGHPIDAPGSPPVGKHGLVGGTTWTFGFQLPHKECDTTCKAEIDKSLKKQIDLHCSSQDDPKKCLQDGLPFTKANYDFVVSMGSSHSALEDIAMRVIWDGAEFGEFSRQNKDIFASLKGRQFDTLDCHSNGAMLCLAALRSGETMAKEVRLFGPQINPGAAALWRDYAANTGAKITIYINNGDPIVAASWMQPTPQTLAGKAATAVWLTNPVTGPAIVSNALFYTWLDSKKAVMDEPLKGYGFEVKRFFGGEDKLGGCTGSPDLACHSMLLYEKNLNILAPTGLRVY